MSKLQNTNPDKQSKGKLSTQANARGERLQSLRGLSRMSRQEVEKRLKISAQTLNYWEQGLEAGLTEKGAQRIITAYQNIGIYCSLSWLLSGKGSPPYLSEQFSNPDLAPNTESNVAPQSLEEMCIYKELNLFHELYPNAVHYQIADDGMLPFFALGDYVAGSKYYHEEIARLLQLNCIVETNMGEIFVRKLRAGANKHTYNLCCVNSETSLYTPILQDTQLLYAAPVIWHRIKNLVR